MNFASGENELSRFLGRANIAFKDRVNMPGMIEIIRQNPSVVMDAIDNLDIAVEQLNLFSKVSEDLTVSSQTLLPNSVEVRRILNGRMLPTPQEFLSARGLHSNDRVARECEFFFQAANFSLQRGEEGAKKEAVNVHIIENLEFGERIDILAMTFYAQRLLVYEKSLNGHGGAVLRSLAEMVAIHALDSRMADSAGYWYSQDEISPLLKSIVNGRVEDLFQEGGMIRDTPNFRVITASSGVANGNRSIVIEPKTPKGNGMLLQAGTMHHSGQMVEISNNAALSSVSFPAVGDVNSRNLRVVLGGLREVPQPGVSTLPALERMEELIRSGDRIYRPQ